MPTAPRDSRLPEGAAPEQRRHPGTEAQELDPEVGPGVHPDAETEATPDETTPGGRP
ncbi:MAG TPA: hypothetical protein VGN51_15740 [Acidimicrobiia bacterium]